jgi:glycosidase
MKLRSVWMAAAIWAVALGGARAAEPAGAPGSRSWADGAVFYEVFVRSFFDANGDGKGDLPGLIAKLDYLNDGDPKTTSDLGVDALWLMPIFKATSYHGYDVTDYEAVNPDYGTNQDFERLIKEAHKRGMRVIIDLVLNHTSIQHPWFQASAVSAGSEKRNWYVWSPDDPGWTKPDGSGNPTWHERGGAYYYGIFSPGMPDLNYRTKAVREEAKRIAKLWLDRGADGFRLDGARHIVEDGDGAGQADTPETHAFWKEFAASVRAEKPGAVLVGEVWGNTDQIAEYFGDVNKVPGGDELPMNFNFPLARGILEAIRGGNADDLGSRLNEVLHTYPKGVVDAPFLANHDQIRVANQLESAGPGGVRAAAAILLTLPGAPFVYYGEELGMRQPEDDADEAKRQVMTWEPGPVGGFTKGRPWQGFGPGGRETINVATETKDPGSLLSRYRKLIALRHHSEALKHGQLEVLSAKGSVLAYLRKLPSETVLVIHNLGGNASPAGPFKVGKPTPLFVDKNVPAPKTGKDGWTLQLPPYSTAVVKIPAK